MLTVGSLFAGIGGIELGLEQTGGFKTIWQVEINEFCRKVLAKHWPNVSRHGDVRTFARMAIDCLDCPCGCEQPFCGICEDHFASCRCVGIDQVTDEWGLPDVICGGFPCQDVSNAGKRKGIHGERSGLWTEFARIIGRLSPKYAIIENSAGIASRGLDLVIRDLAEMRYDAEWFRLRASSFGAAHRRERVYIVAYPSGVGLEGWFTTAEKLQEPVAALADTRDWPTLSEPLSLRSTHGVPDYVDRINAIGNAVVPACARWIGEQILKFEAEGRPKDEEC